MNTKRTYKDAASNFELWAEYVDPNATMTEDEFDQMSIEEKVQMQIEMFGPDPATDMLHIANELANVTRSKFGG